MNNDNELLELCKEVYKRTGWSDTLVKHSKDKHAPNSLVVETVYEKYVGVYENTVGCDECEGEYSLEGLIPLYTSDYLLEKLPAYYEYWDGGNEAGYLRVRKWSADYEAGYWDDNANEETWQRPSRLTSGYTNTPLKALLKLTIALHEAGVEL